MPHLEIIDRGLGEVERYKKDALPMCLRDRKFWVFPEGRTAGLGWTTISNRRYAGPSFERRTWNDFKDRFVEIGLLPQ
jgi:hypothetical protein